MNLKPTKSQILQLLAIHVLLFFAYNIFSQTDSVFSNKALKRNYSITFNLFKPLDLENPRYAFGVGFLTSPNTKYHLEAGFGHEKITPYNYDYNKYMMAELQGEIRFYNRFLKETYTAYQIYVQYVERHLENGTYIGNMQLFCLNYLETDYTSSRCGIKSVVGYSPVYSNRWGFDLYMGFGLRLMWNSFLNTRYDSQYEMGNQSVRNRAYWEGLRIGYTVAGGLKVFYLF
jgi:hypothetical protein